MKLTVLLVPKHSASVGKQPGDVAASGPPSPSHTVSRFSLLSDPLAHKSTDVLPPLKQDLTDLHPGIIIAHHESDFFLSAIVWSLCSWTNTCATYHFCNSAASNPHRFKARKCVSVTEDEMYMFVALQAQARLVRHGRAAPCLHRRTAALRKG